MTQTRGEPPSRGNDVWAVSVGTVIPHTAYS